MDWQDRPEEIEILASRADIIDILAEEPIRKPELVEASGYSRSTIDRAIRDLEEVGYVERLTEGYVATQSGQLAVERYRAFLDEQRAILGTDDILDAIPAAYDLPLELVTESSVETAEAGRRLFEFLSTALEDADSVRLLVPELVDSRQLRLSHSHVAGGDMEVTLQAPDDVLADIVSEFPYLWDDLTEAPEFTARTSETVPFGLALTTVDGEADSVAVFPTDGGDVAGFLHSEAASVVEWGHSVFDSLATARYDVSGDISPPPDEPQLSRFADERLPAPLRTQGFVRVDDSYFDRREPLDPGTAWRAGLDLPEVAAGYAVERGPSTALSDPPATDSESLADQVHQRLLGGDHVALVGPQGSGKSTLCKSVVWRWYDDESGTVLYRETGRGQPFEDTTLLQSLLDETPGHVLVVVEDAVRPEANGIFEVIRSCLGRDDVSFLLDARNREWHDPDEFPADARLRAIREEAIETITVPPLDEQDCENLVERAEETLDTQFDVVVTDLLDDIQAEAGPERAATPGVMTLLFRRLARRIDPTGDSPTALDQNVDRIRADLTDIGETALDVGILVNALNAAGLRVSPAYVYAIAADMGRTYVEIEQALDRLLGSVLYPSSEPMDMTYRTVHESWSVRFLERLLATDDDAERRFGRCLSAFLSLADSADVRDEVASKVTGDVDALEPILIDPTDWADEVVASLFALGRSYPKLAPLFGTTAESYIRLPDSCSVSTRVDVAEWRGRMCTASDDLDRADQEFRRLVSTADRLPEADATRTRAVGRLGQSEVARRRGNFDAGIEHARVALDLAESRSDDVVAARAHRQLGDIEQDRGSFEAATERYHTSLSLEEVVGDQHDQARTHEKIGEAAMKQGDFETARDHLERARESFQQVTDRGGEADCLRTLGAVAMKRNESAVARQHLQQALDSYRETGDRHGQSATLTNLGLTWLRTGALDEARDCFEEALELDTETGNRRGQAQNRNCLGELCQRAGEFDAAADHIEACLDIYRDLGDRHGEALALGSLGSLSRKQGDLETAREHHQASLEQKRELGDELREATSLDNLGVVARRQGDLETAREYHEQALDIQQSRGDAHGQALTLVHLGQVNMEAGDLDAAGEYYEEALDVATEADVTAAVGRARRHLGRLAAERDDAETAREQFEGAISVFEESGYRYDELQTRVDTVAFAVEHDETELATRQSQAARERFADADGVLADERDRIEQFVAEHEQSRPADS